MTTAEALALLDQFQKGDIDRRAVLRAFQRAPLDDLGFAQVDLHRSLRKNFPEVIYGAGKTPTQVVAIAERLMKSEKRVLITRVGEAQVKALRRRFRRAVVHQAARCVSLQTKPLPKMPGVIAVLCAGTSDLPVAEEAAVHFSTRYRATQNRGVFYSRQNHIHTIRCFTRNDILDVNNLS